jgi:DNA-binding MarR family transcriptional regulator
MASLENELKSGFVNQNIKAKLNVLFTANFISNRINAGLKEFGLTHEQYNVLRILRGKHPQSMCQKDVLHRMISRNSNVTLIIKKLTSKNLVTVAQSEKDRREYEINITDSGLAKLAEVDAVITTHEGNFSNLTESEAFHLNALLDKLRG